MLLAGQATWELVPWSGGEAKDVSRAIRPWGQRCTATVDHVELEPGAGPVRVVRCNFLRTQSGPNSREELARLGRVIAGAG